MSVCVEQSRVVLLGGAVLVLGLGGYLAFRPANPQTPNPANSAAVSSANLAPVAPTSTFARQDHEPSTQSLLPLAKGQWTKYRNVKDGVTREATFKVLSYSGTIIEFEIDLNRKIRTILRALVDMKSPLDPQTYKVMKAESVIGGGKPNSMQTDKNPKVANSVIRSLSRIAVPPLISQPREDVNVPAGLFKGAYKVEYGHAVGENSISFQAWVHSDVPFHSAVKYIDDEGSVWELVEYGLTGAMTSMQ